jgi:protease II
LNDRENPEVIDYLNKENEYYQNDDQTFSKGIV